MSGSFTDENGFQKVDVSDILQSAATATGNGAPISARGMEGVLLNVSGITTATIIIEGTTDNSTWTTLTVKDVNAGTSASSITANGIYSVEFEGLLNIRARISAYTSGTINVSGAPASTSIITGNTAGGGASTVADGANTDEGSTTDAAVVGDNAGTISSHLRGLTKMFNDVWDSTNHWFRVKTANSLSDSQATLASFTITLASLANSSTGVGRQSTLVDNTTNL